MHALDGLVALLGTAHALAAWFYFTREASGGWRWPAAWIAATIGCIVAAQSDAWTGYGLFAFAVALWSLWWLNIRPNGQSNWVPENRHQATAILTATKLTVQHVRNFHWSGKRQYSEQWETRTYDLAKLRGMDLFVCTWGDPRIAHTMVSFDFGEASALCFSIETRREVGEKWTPLAGFMRSYELFVIAGDERDLVRQRINVRSEDVRLYRVYATDEMRRSILANYVAQMNRLATRPRFYNTVFNNCTIEIARIVRAAGHTFPLDWRLLVSGYVGDYLYDLELLDRTRPFAELKSAANIRDKSLAADRATDYSRRIREGLADPQAAAKATA
jgi:Domain of unknown function (DUF4105)